jgi:hypothetical protein
MLRVISLQTNHDKKKLYLVQNQMTDQADKILFSKLFKFKSESAL